MVVGGGAARGPRSSIARFLVAVEAELGLRADDLDAAWGPPGPRPLLETLYLGGGTPSLLSPSALSRLVEVVRDRYGLAADAEVTIEANPGPDERGDAAALRAAGVTRLSIGAQSLDDVALRRLGRRHRANDVTATVREARAAGIPSVSLDLLYDVPGQTVGSWQRTLEGALCLEPDHLSLYALTLDDPAAEGLTGPTGDHLPTSAGAGRWRAEARTAQDDDRAAEMYELADGRLAEAGYAWYEISNWARPGHLSRHNLAYWRRRPYEAVGPGGHAFDGRTRRWNAAPLDTYLDALAPPPDAGAEPPLRGPHLPPGGEERISGEIAAAEAAILALRTAEGSGALVARDDIAAWLVERLDRHPSGPLAMGLVARTTDGRLVLTTRGRLLSNEVFSLLLPASSPARPLTLDEPLGTMPTQ